MVAKFSCDLVLCVQVVNSVVMNHVTIGDSCSIQGSVICSNVQLQERVVLKDCQVISFNLFLENFHDCNLNGNVTLLVLAGWSRFCGHCW